MPDAPSEARPYVHRRATVSLVVGVTTLLLFWVCGVGLLGTVAVVQGVRARAEIRSGNGLMTGRGRATAGIVTGASAVVLSLVALYAILESLATRQGM